jgi:uncharacterized protein
LLLAEIEKQGKPIYELFDFFSGTSTGGILTLLLNKPNPIPAAELTNIYQGKEAKKIFKKNFFTPLNYVFKGEKYDKTGIEGVLGDKLENYCLKDTLKPVLVTAYETEGRNATFFNNYDVRYKDLYLKDVARATSAAPTYFEPCHIKSKGTFIDGGIAVNNPAMCAYVEVLKLLKRQDIAPSSKKIIIVSLGTGSSTTSLDYDEIKNWNPIDWIKGPLISSFFDGNSNTVEYQLKQLLSPDCYYRFQLQLPNEKGADALDNTNDKSLEKLKDLTQRYIEQDIINSLPIGWYSQLNKLYQELLPTKPVIP